MLGQGKFYCQLQADRPHLHVPNQTLIRTEKDSSTIDLCWPTRILCDGISRVYHVEKSILLTRKYDSVGTVPRVRVVNKHKE